MAGFTAVATELISQVIQHDIDRPLIFDGILMFYPLYQNLFHHIMADCYYCNKDLELGPHDTQEHDVCHSEWQRRVNAQICDCCGKKPRASASGYGCVECGDSRNADFRDYPGPQ